MTEKSRRSNSCFVQYCMLIGIGIFIGCCVNAKFQRKWCSSWFSLHFPLSILFRTNCMLSSVFACFQQHFGHLLCYGLFIWKAIGEIRLKEGKKTTTTWNRFVRISVHVCYFRHTNTHKGRKLNWIPIHSVHHCGGYNSALRLLFDSLWYVSIVSWFSSCPFVFPHLSTIF